MEGTSIPNLNGVDIGGDWGKIASEMAKPRLLRMIPN